MHGDVSPLQGLRGLLGRCSRAFSPGYHMARLRPFGFGAWIDPVKGVAYVLMVQRSNFPNSDASDVRREFQKAAATALANGRAKP